jgi:hypothetical protein
MLGKFHKSKPVGKKKKKRRKALSRGLHYRSLWLEERRSGQRGMVAPFERGQGQEGDAVPHIDRWNERNLLEPVQKFEGRLGQSV